MIGTILECGLAGWKPGIGDPGIMGWITVLVYAAASLSSLAARSRATPPNATAMQERVFWSLSALLFAFLAVNKQLDLQTLMTDIGRCAANHGGWYGERRVIQVLLIVSLAVAAVAGLAIAMVAMRRSLRRLALAIFGIAFVCGFVLIRAVGFHHVDAMIGWTAGGIQLNWALELPGPLLVIANAWWLVAGRRRSHT